MKRWNCSFMWSRRSGGAFPRSKSSRSWNSTDSWPSKSACRKRAILASAPQLDPRLIKSLDLDVRISLVWDADLTDIDLWVTEPTSEKAFYQNPRTSIGGLVSRDFRQGYGPEEYVLKNAVDGGYRIQANYYGSSAQTLTGPATVKAVVYTNWGRPNEKRQEITLRLEGVREVADVGTVDFGD